jgi:serine O-acetyltransferase
MMFEKIRQDLLANSKEINKAGFRTLLVYRFGQWRMTINSKLLRYPCSFFYRLMEKHVRFKYGIELPYTTIIGDRLKFEHQHCIVIHGNAVIGSDCIIRQGVTIGNKTMDKPYEAPIIGDNVNIGAGAKILGKIKIGNNVQIGANAVVITDIPDNSTVAGIPAKVISKKV